MTFGQRPGFPASARQVERLLVLVRAAGHSDFRDARGPMGLTQRQAAGRFTSDEAAAFIGLLEDAEHHPNAPVEARRSPKLAAVEQTLRGLPAELLAAELQRRGWIVAEP